MITQVGPNRCRRGSERSVDASVEAENVSTWAENLCLSRSVTTELHTAADKRGRGASCREETRQHTHTHTGCGQNTKVVLSNKSLWYERVRWTHFRRQNNMRNPTSQMELQLAVTSASSMEKEANILRDTQTRLCFGFIHVAFSLVCRSLAPLAQLAPLASVNLFLWFENIRNPTQQNIKQSSQRFWTFEFWNVTYYIFIGKVSPLCFYAKY